MSVESIKNKKTLIIIGVALLLAIVLIVCVLIGVNSKKSAGTEKQNGQTQVEGKENSSGLEVVDDPDSVAVEDGSGQASGEVVIPYTEPSSDDDKSSSTTSSEQQSSSGNASSSATQSSETQTGDNTGTDDEQVKFGKIF